MNNLSRLKLGKELKGLIDKRNAELSPLKKLKIAKEVQALRKELGLIGVRDSTLNEQQGLNGDNKPFDLQHYLDRYKQVGVDKEVIYREIALNSNHPDRAFFAFKMIDDNFEQWQEQRQKRLEQVLTIGEKLANDIGSPSIGHESYTRYQEIKTKINKLENRLRSYNEVSPTVSEITRILNEAELAIPKVSIDELEQAQEDLREYVNRNPFVSRQDDEFNRLDNRVTELRKRYYDLNSERQDKVDKKYLELLGDNSLYLDYKKQLEQDFADVEQVGQKVYDMVQKLIYIDEKTSIDWAKKHLKMSRALSKEDRQDVLDFYRMTGGRLGMVNIKSAGRQRAYTENPIVTTNTVMLTNGTRTTTWHELGHNLEFDPKARILANDFLKRRRESDKLYSLRELTGINYSRDEMAYKDSFINPYIGKYYQNGSTEVFSMGMQYLSNPADTAMFFNSDREMFELIIGYLSEPAPTFFSQMIDFDKALEVAKKSKKK